MGRWFERIGSPSIVSFVAAKGEKRHCSLGCPRVTEMEYHAGGHRGSPSFQYKRIA
jgi:NAD(P)H-dependent flavin oxidoreductase YrpB (nitropropane dioxygenase family)